MTDVTAAAVPETPPSPPGDSPWRVHVARVLNLLGVIAALVLIAVMGLLLYQACLVLERYLLRSHHFSTSQSGDRA